MSDSPADAPKSSTTLGALAAAGRRAAALVGRSWRFSLLALLGAGGCGGNEALIVEGPPSSGSRPRPDPQLPTLEAPQERDTADPAPAPPPEPPAAEAPASEVSGPGAPPPGGSGSAEPPASEPPEAEPPEAEPPEAEPPEVVPPEVAEPPAPEPPPSGEPPSEPPGAGDPADPELPPEEEEENPPGGGEPEPPGAGDPEPDDEPVGGGQDEPGEPDGMEEFRIAVIGSSTAAGDGASDGDRAWVGLLESDLEGALTGRLSIWNFAVGGYTAYELEPGSGARGSVDDALAERPHLLVVALAGSNDLTPEITTEKFISQLESVREAATAAGTPTFFMGILPKSFSQGERELLASWNQVMRQRFGSCWVPGAAAPHQSCFIDVFGELASPDLGLAPQFDSGDGNHPNDAGHLTLYRLAISVIKPYVCARAGCSSGATPEP